MKELSKKRVERSSLFCLILLGNVVGVGLALRGWLPAFLQEWLQIHSVQQLFLLLLLEGTGLLLSCWLAGFSAIGHPVSCAALLLHGMLFGCVVLLRVKPVVSTLPLLLWMLPYGLGSSLLLLLAARETLWFSSLLFCYVFHRQWEEQMPHCRRLYLIRYAVLAGFFAGLSLLCCGLQWLQLLIMS